LSSFNPINSLLAPATRHQLERMPEASIVFLIISVCADRSDANSRGVEPTGSAPMACSLSCISADLNALMISAL
jgi:hypothetical protein